MRRKVILSKYGNEYGRKVRKQYEAHDRSVGRRKDMKSYQSRPTPHSGTITTFPEDNIVCEIYEKQSVYGRHTYISTNLKTYKLTNS